MRAKLSLYGGEFYYPYKGMREATLHPTTVVICMNCTSALAFNTGVTNRKISGEGSTPFAENLVLVYKCKVA